MKTYVLKVSKTFPLTHPRKGEPTGFPEKITSGDKRHTIRDNVELWTKRAKEVHEGRAVLSIRVWSGKPYRSSQVEFAEMTDCAVQTIERTPLGWFIDGKDSDVADRTIAWNDGLAAKDFRDWFKGSWKPNTPKVIIHFTDFRY